jgi:hypothetical protein
LGDYRHPVLDDDCLSGRGGWTYLGHAMKNEPAFPGLHPSKECHYQDAGMTLRDYFAAHAPEPHKNWHGGERNYSDIIEWRWHYADAMLRAREA